MGGCQGKAKKKSRNSLQTSDCPATKKHPVVTFKQQKQRKSSELQNTNPGNQTGKDKELQQTKFIPLAKEEDLELSDIKVISKTQNVQKREQKQNDTLHYTDKKDIKVDSVEKNGEVKKAVTKKQDETQEKTTLKQDETQEKTTQVEVQEDGVVTDMIQGTEPKMIHSTSNNNAEANYENGANFAKSQKPGQDNGQSSQPPSLVGQSLQPPSVDGQSMQTGQPNAENQRNNNSGMRNQQGPSSAYIATSGSSTGLTSNPPGSSSENPGISRNIYDGLHVQQPESATYQSPESQNSSGTSKSPNTRNASNFEPYQPASNQSPESGNTQHMVNEAHQNPGPSGTQSELNDNTTNAVFAQPIGYEDDIYRQVMGDAGEKSGDFEGFRKNERSKKSKPSAKNIPQNQKRKESDDDDDSDDTDSDETDSDHTDSDDTYSDDTDSDESSSDEKPKKKQRKKKTRHGKVKITNITGAQFAAIGKNAKYIDNRVVMGPNNNTKKTKKKTTAKQKPSNNKKDKSNTKHQENTESHVKPPNGERGQMRPNNTDRIQNLNVVVEAAKSVGILHGPNEFSGTVFRVGDDYVMTAWHVVKHLIAEGTPPNTYDNESNLCKEDIFIDFQYHSQRRRVSDQHKFSLMPAVEYCNADLDIAVLRLKKKDKEDFPPPLIHFMKIIPEHYKKPIYLVGHTGGEPKEDDPKITIWNPYEWRLNELTKWSLENFHRDGYTEMNHPQKLIFDCTFRHGASGSPGISHAIGPDNEDIPVIVTVLLRGFPDFYYFADFSDNEKNRVPPEMLKQQGVRIEAVMNDMENINHSLYQNIFCRFPSAQPDVSRSRPPVQPVVSISHGNTIPHSPISSPVTEGPSSIIPSNTSSLQEDVVQQY